MLASPCRCQVSPVSLSSTPRQHLARQGSHSQLLFYSKTNTNATHDAFKRFDVASQQSIHWLVVKIALVEVERSSVLDFFLIDVDCIDNKRVPRHECVTATMPGLASFCLFGQGARVSALGNFRDKDRTFAFGRRKYPALRCFPIS